MWEKSVMWGVCWKSRLRVVPKFPQRETRGRVKSTPREKGGYVFIIIKYCYVVYTSYVTKNLMNFNRVKIKIWDLRFEARRGVIFTPARVSLSLLAVRKNGDYAWSMEKQYRVTGMTTRVMGSWSGIGDCFFVFAFFKLVRHCVEVCRSVPDLKKLVCGNLSVENQQLFHIIVKLSRVAFPCWFFLTLYCKPKSWNVEVSIIRQLEDFLWHYHFFSLLSLALYDILCKYSWSVYHIQVTINWLSCGRSIPSLAKLALS